MENNDKEYVYLTRVLKEPYCEFLEAFLNGEEVEQLGKPSSALVPSTVESTLDENFPDSLLHAKKTAEISSYFFYSSADEDGLNELRKRTLDLLYSPATESGAMKQKNGQKCNADELYGGEIKSMLILKAPLDLLTAMSRMGLAELRTGEYGTDDEKSIYPEIAIGDDGLKHILRTAPDCKVMACGEFHRVLNNEKTFSDARDNKFDAEKLFDASYTPDYKVNVFDEIAKVNAVSNDKPEYQSELADAKKWLEEMKNSGMSDAELKDLEKAFHDAQTHYSFPDADEFEDGSPEL